MQIVAIKCMGQEFIELVLDFISIFADRYDKEFRGLRMEDRRRIEEIILNGTEDELSQLRLWLFKESVRLENMESSLEERYARLEEDEM